ncbi:MAG: type II secretion protein F [Vulcanisaeta sp.]
MSIGRLTINIPIIANVLYTSILTIAMALELLIPSIPRYKAWKVNNEINMELPSVIRVIRDGLRSGLSISEAVNLAKNIGKGSVWKILNTALIYQSSGETTIYNYIMNEASRLGNDNLSSLAIIINTVLMRGAREVEVLDMAYKSFESVISYMNEKNAQLRPYVALIYVVMIIYIILAAIIAYFLLPQIMRLSEVPSGPGISSIELFPISIQLFASLIGLSVIIQSLIAGAIIGRITYGKSSIGLLHSSILMIMLTMINFMLYSVFYLH